LDISERQKQTIKVQSNKIGGSAVTNNTIRVDVSASASFNYHASHRTAQLDINERQKQTIKVQSNKLAVLPRPTIRPGGFVGFCRLPLPFKPATAGESRV